MTNNNPNFQKNHFNLLQKKFIQLQTKPDGFLFYQPSGVHFIVVEKQQNFIKLGLIDQVNLSSALTQSQFNLNDPFNLIADYSKAIVLSLLWQNNPKNIYIAGLGGGIIPLFFYHYFSETMINTTEIDPNIIKIANQFFGLDFDDRLTVDPDDGRVFLTKVNPDFKYDLIITDVILGNGYTPYRLFTKEFYQLCQDHLSDQGVMIINLVETDPFLLEKIKTIQECFKYVYVCSLASGNIVIIANNHQSLSSENIMKKAKILQEEYNFNFSLLEVASELKSLTDNIELLTKVNQVQSLTDNHPPDDYFDYLPSFNTMFAKVNQGDPCPCGSGKLYQNCHGL